MDGLIAEYISKTYAGAHGLSFAALRDVHSSGARLLHLPGGESGSGEKHPGPPVGRPGAPRSGDDLSLDGEDTSGWSTEGLAKRRTKLQAVFQDASGTRNPMRSVRSNVEEAMVNLDLPLKAAAPGSALVSSWS